jgi:hypothetical protein
VLEALGARAQVEGQAQAAGDLLAGDEGGGAFDDSGEHRRSF